MNYSKYTCLPGATDASMIGTLTSFIFLSALCEGAVDQMLVKVVQLETVSINICDKVSELCSCETESFISCSGPRTLSVSSVFTSAQKQQEPNPVSTTDNVHWFRAGSEEPHTGLMYNSTNYSCVYRLSKTIGHSSDAGTYYCAVDTCGHILFGTGTKVDTDQPKERELLSDLVTVALSVLLCACVLVIIVLCVCVRRATGQSAQDQIPVTVVRPGDRVTFTCSAKYEHVYWYKQTPGHVTKSQSCVHVRQSPSSAAVVPGHSVSLQCSLQPKNNKSQIQCPQQDNVHWFRAGSEEPHTGLMYNSTNYSCVYRLSKTIGHSSDAGTYYCAVDTCGHILFGQEPKWTQASYTIYAALKQSGKHGSVYSTAQYKMSKLN
ncbi:hypothetical protein WMY93_032073 [Mugilogobius chulae]|uniref:Ig-like domain-containing protein n=1 Tax=Mugilogobius chulae TaxID=88201 RepID=A0AAW0MD86_9GOBI